MSNGAAKVAVAIVAAGLAACGGGAKPGAASAATVGPAGGTVVAQGVRVSFPPGALSGQTQIEVTELPRHEGEPRRVHVGPDDTPLASPVTVVVRSDDGDASDEKLVTLENEIEHGIETEHHDQIEHGREAEVEHLGEFELRHARTCAVPCGAGFECDDGVCKADDDPVFAGSAASTSCPAGMELDLSDGFCKPHGGTGH
jgi:hypothetical protein